MRSGSGGREGGRDAAGLPPRIPAASGRDRWAVGVDVGGTKVLAGAVPAEGGRPRRVERRATGAERGGAAVAGMIAEMVGIVADGVARNEGGTVLGIGIGSPGPLDRAAGTVLRTPNLGWRNVPLRALVSAAAGLPATLDNDANCAAYGEWWAGAGRGFDHLAALTVGTGIGGGVVLRGELFHGTSDAAGEVGHMTVERGGRKCGCGGRGCLEAYASGPAIAARAAEGLRRARSGAPLLWETSGGDPGRITAEMVARAALRGDRYARAVMKETAEFLGAGVANLVHLLNPEAVVIGGGVARAGDPLFLPLRAEVRRRVFPSAFASLRILSAELSDQAGVVGAAGLFLKQGEGLS